MSETSSSSVRELRKWLMQVEEQNRDHYQQNLVKKSRPFGTIRDKIQRFEDQTLCISRSVSSEQPQGTRLSSSSSSVQTTPSFKSIKSNHDFAEEDEEFHRESFGFSSLVSEQEKTSSSINDIQQLPEEFQEFCVISTNAGKSLEEVFQSKKVVEVETAILGGASNLSGGSSSSSNITGPVNLGSPVEESCEKKPPASAYLPPSPETLSSNNWPVDNNSTGSWDEQSNWSTDSERPSVLPDAIDDNLGQLLLGTKKTTLDPKFIDYKKDEPEVATVGVSKCTTVGKVGTSHDLGTPKLGRFHPGSPGMKKASSRIQRRKEELEKKWAAERKSLKQPTKKTKWEPCRGGKYRKQVVLEYSSSDAD